MSTTITKAIGEGFDKNAIYAALAYDEDDHFGGYQIKSVCLNSTYKLYFRDTSQYIYSSAASTLDIVAATVAITGDLTVSGSITYGATEVPVATGYMGTLTVGVNGTGYDVTFYGDTSGYYWKWDQDADTNGGMVLVGTAAITGATTITGATSITGATTVIGALTVGVDGTGHDITVYGDTASYRILWDQNGDTNGALYIGQDEYGIMFNLYGDVTGCGVFWDPSDDTNGKLTLGTSGGSAGVDLLCYGHTNGKYFLWDQSADGVVLVGTETITGNVSITGAVGVVGAVTVGVDDTGHDVKLYGAGTGYYWQWDQDNTTNGGVVLVGAMTQTGSYAITGSITMTAGDINLNQSTTGVYDLVLTANQADALSIKDSTGDIVTFTTTTGALAMNVVGICNVSNTTDASATTTAALKTAGGLGVAKKAYIGTDLVMVGGDIDLSTATTGTYDLTLKANQADALSIKDSTGDLMVFTTTTDGKAIAIPAVLGVSGVTTFTGNVNAGVDGTGVDVKLYGDTTGAYCLWDMSDDRLILTKAGIDIGVTDYSIDFIGTPSVAFFRVLDDGTIASVTNGTILNDISTTANAGFIKVLVGANIRYIALYEAHTGA